MKLSDKITTLRKSNGWSQEDLAEQLNVSRQAISRWENGTALPDANNILQLSKLFNVTTDYLLNEDYSSDDDIPCVKEVHNILESKKVRYGKLFLIASIAFLLSPEIYFKIERDAVLIFTPTWLTTLVTTEYVQDKLSSKLIEAMINNINQREVIDNLFKNSKCKGWTIEEIEDDYIISKYINPEK